MKRRIRRKFALVAAAVTLAVTTIGVVVNSASATSGIPADNSTLCRVAASPPALQAFGLSDDGTVMVAFNTDRPQVLNWVREPSGLDTDSRLIGLDCRVQDGKLYAVGDQGGIYSVTLTGALDVILTKVSQLGVALRGNTFGMDFNPSADRLRVISDAGQNLRHDLNTHVTVVDSPLSTQAGPLPLPSPSTPTRGVTAAAYTNNDINPNTATTLFDINTITNQVVVQSPANTGLLAATGTIDIDISDSAGFDIYSGLNGGKTVSNTGFATLVPISTMKAALYTVDMLTGIATHVGQFPLPITEIAVQLG